MAITIDGSTGWTYADGIKQKFGTADDLEIFHDGSYSQIKNTTGGLYLENTGEIGLISGTYASGEWMVRAIKDGAVQLYYDSAKIFETLEYGARIKRPSGGSTDLEVIGCEGQNAYIHLWADEGDDNADKWRMGALTDGTFRLYNYAGGSWETSINAAGNGSVGIYYNNSKKLETFGEGLVIHGGTSSGEIKMYSNDGLRGYVYANTSSNMGFLKNDGNWRFQVENDGDYIFYGSNVSDRDRKDNITTVIGTSLDKITKLVPKTYNWKATDDGKTPTDKIFTGFIAQEVNEHLPSLVTGTDGQKNMAIDYNGLLAHAVKAITELSAEVDTLKTKVAALEAG